MIAFGIRFDAIGAARTVRSLTLTFFGSPNRDSKVGFATADRVNCPSSKHRTDASNGRVRPEKPWSDGRKTTAWFGHWSGAWFGSRLARWPGSLRVDPRRCDRRQRTRLLPTHPLNPFGRAQIEPKQSRPFRYAHDLSNNHQFIRYAHTGLGSTRVGHSAARTAHLLRRHHPIETAHAGDRAADQPDVGSAAGQHVTGTPGWILAHDGSSYARTRRME
jgi:hypothetical protein